LAKIAEDSQRAHLHLCQVQVCHEFANEANMPGNNCETRGWLAALGVAESYLRHLRLYLQIIDAESGEITGTLTSPKLAHTGTAPIAHRPGGFRECGASVRYVFELPL
jgi:hypothetical protein